MSCPTLRTRASALALLAPIAFAGCADTADPVSIDEASPAFSMHGQPTSVGAAGATNQDLAALRALLAPLHRLEAAMDAGWSELVTPCLENPPEGGMGFHYGNPAFIDGEVDLLEPELLLFAPWRNGDVRFVGIEYIVPFDLWEGEEPPTLLGRDFHRVEDAGVWGLHIWLWHHNPSGVFADWNPRISC